MNDEHLFSRGMWQEILMETVEPPFNTPALIRYCKYVFFQAGLGGMFTSRTPAQIIQGYHDPMFQNFWDKELYLGGDRAKLGSNFSLVNGLTNPPGNTISMF